MIVSCYLGYRRTAFLDCDGGVWVVVYGKEDKMPEKLQLPPIQTVSIGNDHMILIDYEGGVWTYGLNTEGQLGFGDKKARPKPEQVPGMRVQKYRTSVKSARAI